MSRTSKPAASTVKPATSSGKASKPVPTQWKDRLAAEDYDELKQTFEVFDEDGSGSIDPEEIGKVLEELGLDRRNPSSSLSSWLLRIRTVHHFEEFVDIVASRVGETKTKDGLRKTFAIFDKDENGVIDFEELKAIAKEIKTESTTTRSSR
jgi:Ca2+-binding EF-hand superfamily protein